MRLLMHMIECFARVLRFFRQGSFARAQSHLRGRNNLKHIRVVSGSLLRILRPGTPLHEHGR